MDGMCEGGKRTRTPRHSLSHSRPTSFTIPGHPSFSTGSPANPHHSNRDSHTQEHGTTSPHHPQQQQQLVSLLFLTHSPTSDRYEGVDMELRVKLAALHFTARRPTVACLITVGGDMAAIYAASTSAHVEVRWRCGIDSRVMFQVVNVTSFGLVKRGMYILHSSSTTISSHSSCWLSAGNYVGMLSLSRAAHLLFRYLGGCHG